MIAQRPYTMFIVAWMHYVPIASSEYNEYTTSLYKVQGRMNAQYPYTMYRIEWLHYVPIASSG